MSEEQEKQRGHVVLDTPIMRGEQKIESVVVRRPTAGELRGLTLGALSQLDVGALIKLLPRITVPPLLEQEVAAMDPADLMQCGGEVMDFLLPTSARPESLQP